MTTRTVFALPWKRILAVEQLTPGELPSRYLATVLRYATARLGPGAEAEDVAAEVFVAAFASWKNCPTPATETSDHDPVRAWLFWKDAARMLVPRRRASAPEIVAMTSQKRLWRIRFLLILREIQQFYQESHTPT
jgi:hypothetical protein